jgi:rubrerythrin
MSNDQPTPPGSAEFVRALEELVRASRRSIASYQAAERVVRDHRVQAALAQLRRDHERHERELTTSLAEVGGDVAAWDGGEVAGPVIEALGRDDPSGRALLAAVERVEAELRAAYERCVERGYAEPIRAMLSRHRREEEAHEEWLRESGWWRELRGEGEPDEETRGS